MFARPRLAPFGISLLTHGLILAWVASGPLYEKPKSLYSQAIAPHSSKIIWYNFSKKLPEVTPPVTRTMPSQPRAEVKIASQEIVAGSTKAPRARQFIWQPAPKLELKQDLQSPNLVSVRSSPPPPPAKPKMFVPPQEAPKPKPASPVPAPAPEIQTERALNNIGNPLGMQPVKAPPRQFIAPEAGKPVPKANPILPEAPTVASNRMSGNPQLALGNAPTQAPARAFVPPTSKTTSRPSPFGTALPDAPALPQSGTAAVNVAIVGLDPKVNAPAPTPEGSRDAQFSGGPQPRSTGGSEGVADGALLSVPGLLVRNAKPDNKPPLMARAAPTANGNLLAAMHTTTLPARTAVPTLGERPSAMRVTGAPDSLLNGRVTYAMTVQMPNTTSYAGSWMIWFAERQRENATDGNLSAPIPLRKVDPKYYPAAIADRVEGIVRLTAVIRKDGQVDSVTLLQHLDDRLDQSATEAIDKWRFEPAQRDGQPVDVDAVIDIPFRLAPKTGR